MRRTLAEQAFDEYWYYIWRMMTMAEDKFKNYHRIQVIEARPYEPGEDLTKVLLSEGAKEGDMILRNPKDRDDMWLVRAEQFEKDFESMEKARGQKREQF